MVYPNGIKNDVFPLETSDLVTFREEIVNGKFHFLCVMPVFFVKLFVLWCNSNNNNTTNNITTSSSKKLP